MNLTEIIRETGKRIRQGKLRREQLTNEQVKLVLENAIEVMREGLASEGRMEIQGFLVIERKVTPVKPTRFRGKLRKGERVRWVVRLK